MRIKVEECLEKPNFAGKRERVSEDGEEQRQSRRYVVLRQRLNRKEKQF